jgi:hypothetical protein
MSVCRVFHHNVTTINLGHTIATMILDTIVAFATIVAFVALGCPADIIARREV